MFALDLRAICLINSHHQSNCQSNIDWNVVKVYKKGPSTEPYGTPDVRGTSEQA